MGKNKVTTLLVACMMIMLCTATIVGGTYALWSDSITTENHLAAGRLDVTLQRTALKKHMLGANGAMDDVTDNVAATINSNTNFFGIQDGELVVPTSVYQAKLKLENSGSVAVNYSVTITVDEDSDTALAQQLKALAQQLKVYIGTDNAQGEPVYGEGHALANASEIETPAGSLNAGSATEFWVKVEFVNVTDTAHNDAQGQNVSFDLLVNAIQKVD